MINVMGDKRRSPRFQIRQTYHPRLLADLPGIAALRRLWDAQITALLYGLPGTGKTSLVEVAFMI